MSSSSRIGGWICVEDKLPPRHENVLCLNRDGYIFEGRICAGMHKPVFTYPRGDGDPSNTAPSWINVTHWMPKPAFPAAEGEGAWKEGNKMLGIDQPEDK